eukprot:superscaffoldBa00001824_g12179
MVDSMDMEKQQKRCCISGKQGIIIGVTVLVCSLAVGLGVGLSLPDTTTTPAPTAEPTQPPSSGRGPCTPSSDSSGDWRNFRLPRYVNPIHYDLHLEPDLVDDTYTGTVEIHVEVSKPTRHLWLHIRETFVSAMPRLRMLDSQGGQKEVSVKSCFEYNPQQYVVVEATEELPITGPGEVYVLSLDFQGWLNGSVVGFYRVIYTEQGVTKKIAATDHEPTDARKSFPCFDEPNKKATYNISITHDANYNALSNMPPEWFGNIVTMDWWDDLWLNEGFASFFEYIGVEKAEPNWGMRDIMIISDVLPVMVDDALLSSHPIIVNVSTPAEITSVFDAISYNKGASILRMLEDWMGKDVFRDGCRKYLKDYHFKNAKTDNFWASLASVSGLPVAEVMDTWTKQMGYPLLNLFVSEGTAKLSQKRFLLDPKADASQPPSALGYSWTIPVRWHSVKSNKNILTMFDKSNKELIINNYSPSVDGLLKINHDHIGFYRVNHDGHQWDAISQQFQNNHSEFDAADRTSYIDDVFALARADIIDYGNAFNLTKYLTNETEYIVWDRVASSIAYVRDMLSNNAELYPKFQTLFRYHVKAISTQLGWKDEGEQTQRLLRETVLSIACQMGDKEALNEASRIFDQWINGRDVEVNLRLLVYRYGMKNSGTKAKWDVMFQRYKDTSLAQEKDKLLYGLASVENVELLHSLKIIMRSRDVEGINVFLSNRLLEATKDENVVRSQDLFTVVRYVSLNPLGQSMAWDWTTLNWDYLVNRYTINDRNLGRLLSRITTTYNTELQLWKMENFFRLTPDAGAGEMPRQQALETVRNNIEWIKRNEDEIKGWLHSNVA